MEHDDDDFDADCGESSKARTRAEIDGSIAALSAKWRREHRRRALKARKELLQEHAQAPACERLVLGMVAHDAALSEVLGEIQVELAGRAHVLINNVQTTLALVKALREVTSCRGAATRRVEEALLAVGTLRGQRSLAQHAGRLRVVA